MRYEQGVIARTAAALVAAAFIVYGFYGTVAVDPAGLDAPEAEFSAERAMEHVRVIAAEPHPMGSPEIEDVRSYLVEQARALGMDVDLHKSVAPDYFGDAGSVDVVNVIAWIPGTANTAAVVLMGHYDTVPTTPGGNDNTSAVAAMLETARALQAGPPPANDIVFLFTDGEEPAPQYGSSAFAALPGVLDRLGLVVNFEANGGSGASTLVQISGPRGTVVSEWSRAAPVPVGYSFLTEMAEMLGEIGTDFDAFAEADAPGLHFAYLRGSPIYHTMADDIDAVGLASLQHHGENALAVARHFGNLDLSEISDSGSQVFFTLRPGFVRYPAWAALIPALLALGLLGWVVVRRGIVGGAARAAGAAALGGLAGAVAGTLVWMVVSALRSSPAVFEVYAYLAVLVSVSVAAAWWVERKVGRGSDADRRTGRVAVWVLLAVVTALLLPGFSYLFGWAALAGSACLMWRPAGLWALARFSVVAAPALVLMTPAVDYLYLFAGPRPGNPDSEMPVVVLVPLLFAVAAAGLAAARWHLPDEAA